MDIKQDQNKKFCNYRGNERISQKNKITTIILVHDNKRTIEKCIRAIKDISDELIIIDDYSKDDTLKIIRSIYPKFTSYKRRLNRDFASQRNFGISKAKNQWILMIDSDEILTDSLNKNILKELENPKYDAYTCKRKNYSLDRGNISNLDRSLIFKSFLKFEGKLHEQINNVRAGEIKGYVDHFSWINCEDWLEDMNIYSTNQAEKWISEKRDWGKTKIVLLGLFVPPFLFLKMFFWEGRWRRGFIAGLLYCIGCSAEFVYSILKYYELKYIKPKN